MIYTLKNPIKNFPWGSRTTISDYFGIDNPNSEHQAELWMGAHPLASSSISYCGEDVLLCDVITQNPEYWLGKQATTSSPSLPFLMKILAADKPLSIQVHPSKSAAELGFAAENQKGIPLDAATRNYKDTNHKPELVYAITPYLAMNGFREFKEIIANFDALELSTLKELFLPFKHGPTSSTLATFFSGLLALEGELKKQAINELLTSIKGIENMPFLNQNLSLISCLYKLYPEDIGLFAPLLLNVIELQPGEAMFLYSETPHAYLHGLGIEIMANSDNVLRAGLTTKNIDVEELVKNSNFEPTPLIRLTLEPSCVQINRLSYPIPVKDFNFDILTPEEGMTLSVLSPEILLCLSGSIRIVVGLETQEISKGSSVVIPASAGLYTITGSGKVARAYC
ncbi:mannose-6-phosphate isomerase, class I [Vibrio cyclitrophicus]|uniref:mannose-6-phosphate isomerase, class I n=1 Tax=Vibrio cyclitrophicus TaxID=47951 RepID=UPI0007EEAC94|nr:mannose-6-phosphate isomerase, class I [Vibrio cyclitrophicus]OBS93552.1 mannose-6-phosphate isomerase, class I [Vibrio cyclitrophicus]